MISFHKLDAKCFSLAIFSGIISKEIKFLLCAELLVRAWGSDGAFPSESQVALLDHKKIDE